MKDKARKKENKVVKLEGCNHKFHLECLNNVEGKKCPLCRKPMKYGKGETVLLVLSIAAE